MDFQKHFITICEGLVSNDSKIREQNLESTKDLLIQISDKSSEEINDFYTKIWRSLFYFYWNSDKPSYQKKMADKVANIFYDENSKINNENEIIWIKTFFLEFIKKWPKIDFLRLDKYVMLTQTIVNKFFESNLHTQNFENILKIFNIMNQTITSGHYNFNFVSVILKIISNFIEEIFKKESEVEIKTKFLECYFLEFFEKLLNIYINVKDNRENNSFQDLIFEKIAQKLNDSTITIIKIVELKSIFLKKIFDFAKSKDEYPENKRRILYKIYKRIKYDKTEDEGVVVPEVDPVNQYTLNKTYTNKLKKSRLERMKLMIERQKNQKRIDKVIQEKKKEELLAKINEKENKAKVEVLKENVIQVDDDELVEDEDESGSGSSNNYEESDEQLEESDEENYMDDDEFYQDEFYDDEEDEDDEEGEEEEDDDSFDFEEYDCEDEILAPKDAIKKFSNDEEMDPRLLYFLADCEEEDLKELSEEDKKILEAYKNSQKNTELLRASKKVLIQNRKNQKDSAANAKANENENFGLKENNSNGSANKQTVVDMKSDELMASSSKRKGSVNSNGSNNTSNKKKKKVTFRTNTNQFTEYDMLKPIVLCSKRKLSDLKNIKPTKGSLRIRNKNKRL